VRGTPRTFCQFPTRNKCQFPPHKKWEPSWPTLVGNSGTQSELSTKPRYRASLRRHGRAKPSSFKTKNRTKGLKLGLVIGGRCPHPRLTACPNQQQPLHMDGEQRMAEVKPSPWQQAAQKRWPSASIEGDGPFALHAACSDAGHVRLFHFAIEARNGVYERCSHAFCKMQHSAFRLTPVQQTQQQYQPSNTFADRD